MIRENGWYRDDMLFLKDESVFLDTTHNLTVLNQERCYYDVGLCIN